MKTFYDLKKICDELQEKQNFLLNCYAAQKKNEVVDPEVIEEFNKMALAIDEATEILEKYKERW